MQRHSLYAYVDNSDLDDDVTGFEKALVALAVSSGWAFARPVVVDEQSMGVCIRSGNLPGWELGMNLALTAPGLFQCSIAELVSAGMPRYPCRRARRNSQ